MSQELTLLLVTAATVALFILGTPVILCMGLWIVLASYFADALPLSNVGQSAVLGLKIFALLAMPLFILTGDLIRAAGIARRLTDFAHAMFRFLPGQLAVATTVASGCFAAISGSNAATAATIGRIMIPEMTRRGYHPFFAAATAAAGGTIGIIIPPSLVFIIYGILLRVSPGELFIAGIIPGALMVAAMTAMACWIARRNAWDVEGVFSLRESVRTFWGARLGFVGIALALGGIYAGWFSPTEIAGAVVLYGLLAGLFLTRQLRWRAVPTVLLESAVINGLIAPIVAFSIILQETFVAVGVPGLIGGLLEPIASSWTAAILVSMLVTVVAGCVLESVPCVIILAPVLAPIAMNAGVDPIHFGIVFCVGIAIGFITPPYGLNLYVTSGITGLPYMPIAMRALPYLAALVLVWIPIAFLPQLSLALLGK